MRKGQGALEVRLPGHNKQPDRTQNPQPSSLGACELLRVAKETTRNLSSGLGFFQPAFPLLQSCGPQNSE